MLVLAREEGQSITIGDNIIITVLSIRAGHFDRVSLGITAPAHIKVDRAEVDLARRVDQEVAARAVPVNPEDGA